MDPDGSDVGNWLRAVVPPSDAPDGQQLAELRRDLDADVADLGTVLRGPDAGGAALRMNKSRLTDLAQCERSAVARTRARDDTNEAQLKGVALDLYVAHQLVAGRVREPLADLRSMLEATADQDRLMLLDELDHEGLDQDLASLAHSVAAAWGAVGPEWVPRTQTSVAVVLADGDVVVSGRVDVELGGLDTGLPGVVIEVKSGAPAISHPSEVYLYALLCSLRDRVAPAAVARWYPGSPPASTPVTLGVLEAAGRRLVDGVRRWSELSTGEVPTETPGPWCGWCHDRSLCPSADQGDPIGLDP